ncbi:MAG TPA: hypothetical protein VIO61_17310 [Anaerolineaceae bacterium]
MIGESSQVVLSLVITAGIVLVIFSVIVWKILQMKRRKAAREDILHAAGFREMPAPWTEYLERIKQLQVNLQGSQLRLQALFFRNDDNARFIYFDLLDTGGDETTWLGEGVLVQAPDLQLPRFFVLPWITKNEGAGSLLANMSESFIQMLAGAMGMKLLPDMVAAGLPEQYRVLAIDVESTKQFLASHRLTIFGCLGDSLELSAGGDAFLVKTSTFRKRMKKSDPFHELVKSSKAILSSIR